MPWSRRRRHGRQGVDDNAGDDSGPDAGQDVPHPVTAPVRPLPPRLRLGTIAQARVGRLAARWPVQRLTLIRLTLIRLTLIRLTLIRLTLIRLSRIWLSRIWLSRIWLLTLVLVRILRLLERIPRRLLAHDSLPCAAPVPRPPASGDAPVTPVVHGIREPDISP